MTDIAQYRKTANRLMVGPGSSQRLTAKVLPAVLFERYFDPFNWFTQIVRCGDGTPDVTSDAIEVSGVNTEVSSVLVSGYRITTGGADNDNAVLHPHLTDNMSGIVAYWDSDKEPWIMARVLIGSLDAGALLNAEYAVGLDVEYTVATAADAAASAEADAARWQITVGAATGANWIAETSVGGTDDLWNSGVAGQRATFVDLAVIVSKARKPHYYMGGNLQHVGPSLTAATVMMPKIIAQGAEADAKTADIQFAAWGQRHVARA